MNFTEQKVHYAIWDDHWSHGDTAVYIERLKQEVK